MVAEGLRLGAKTARHQAGICMAQRHLELARWLNAFADTLDSMADIADDEPTDPLIESVKCVRCGTDVMIVRGFDTGP